jgi:L-asparagine oxygenase
MVATTYLCAKMPFRRCRIDTSSRENITWRVASPPARMNPKQLVEKQGYALLPRFLPDLEPAAAAAKVGVPEQVDGLRLVQELVPTTPDKTTPNTYSGNFGLESFPLHTDLAHWATPPRYLMLRCARGDADALTQIVDGKTVIAALGSRLLARCLTRPRRPMEGTFQLLPIWHDFSESGEQLFRWDSIYLKPANEYAISVFQQIDAFLSRAVPVAKVLLNQGDTLLIDNWRLLHGRSPIQNPESSRKIHRLYLSSLT